jgi:hypothetical protein
VVAPTGFDLSNERGNALTDALTRRGAGAIGDHHLSSLL